MATRLITRALSGLAFATVLAASSASSPTKAATTRRALDSTVAVRYADLNLNSAEGTRVLYARIRGAAQQVCGTSSSLWNARRLRAWTECYREAIDDSVRRIDRPALTALHLRIGATRPG